MSNVLGRGAVVIIRVVFNLIWQTYLNIELQLVLWGLVLSVSLLFVFHPRYHPSAAWALLSNSNALGKRRKHLEKGGAKPDLCSLGVAPLVFLKRRKFWAIIKGCVCRYVVRYDLVKHGIFFLFHSLKLISYSQFLGVINLFAPREGRRQETTLKEE